MYKARLPAWRKLLHALYGMRGSGVPRLICAALLVWIAGVLPAASGPRHVVLLYDERISLPGLSLLHDSLTRALTSGTQETIEIYREEMDLSRFSSEADPHPLAGLPSGQIRGQEHRCGGRRDARRVGLHSGPWECGFSQRRDRFLRD